MKLTFCCCCCCCFIIPTIFIFMHKHGRQLYLLAKSLRLQLLPPWLRFWMDLLWYYYYYYYIPSSYICVYVYSSDNEWIIQCCFASQLNHTHTNAKRERYIWCANKNSHNNSNKRKTANETRMQISDWSSSNNKGEEIATIFFLFLTVSLSVIVCSSFHSWLLLHSYFFFFFFYRRIITHIHAYI